jgi:hypothetical protein
MVNSLVRDKFTNDFFAVSSWCMVRQVHNWLFCSIMVHGERVHNCLFCSILSTIYLTTSIHLLPCSCLKNSQIPVSELLKMRFLHFARICTSATHSLTSQSSSSQEYSTHAQNSHLTSCLISLVLMPNCSSCKSKLMSTSLNIALALHQIFPHACLQF